ncbi:MAG: glycosyltransferase family 4 protein [Actinomycetota bacterium]
MADAVLVTSSFLPGRGGIESYLAELCSRLAPRLAVVAPARRDGEPIPSGLPYPTHPYPYPMLISAPRLLRAIARTAESRRVLFGTPWPLVLLGPGLARRGLRYAVIVHGAELLVPAAVPGVRQVLKRALSRAELLLPVSEFTADRLRDLLGEGAPRIEVLRAAVDLERFRPGLDATAVASRLGIPEGAGVILCLGRLVKRKGVDRLIRAVHELARDGRRIIAVVGGTGPDESRLRRLAAHLGAPVIFAGRVGHAGAAALYARADVFALPVADRWFGLEVEGLGVALLEAQASGTPCVAGRSGGTTEAVIDKETGFVIEGRDVAALGDRINWLLHHPREAAAMGEAGRAHVAAHFSGELPPALLSWLES